VTNDRHPPGSLAIGSLLVQDSRAVEQFEWIRPAVDAVDDGVTGVMVALGAAPLACIANHPLEACVGGCACALTGC